jgi:hypothetical protein
MIPESYRFIPCKKCSLNSFPFRAEEKPVEGLALPKRDSCRKLDKYLKLLFILVTRGKILSFWAGENMPDRESNLGRLSSDF